VDELVRCLRAVVGSPLLVRHPSPELEEARQALGKVDAITSSRRAAL